MCTKGTHFTNYYFLCDLETLKKNTYKTLKMHPRKCRYDVWKLKKDNAHMRFKNAQRIMSKAADMVT